jgi:hypothetical protein
LQEARCSRRRRATSLWGGEGHAASGESRDASPSSGWFFLAAHARGRDLRFGVELLIAKEDELVADDRLAHLGDDAVGEVRSLVFF